MNRILTTTIYCFIDQVIFIQRRLNTWWNIKWEIKLKVFYIALQNEWRRSIIKVIEFLLERNVNYYKQNMTIIDEDLTITCLWWFSSREPFKYPVHRTPDAYGLWSWKINSRNYVEVELNYCFSSNKWWLYCLVNFGMLGFINRFKKRPDYTIFGFYLMHN